MPTQFDTFPVVNPDKGWLPDIPPHKIGSEAWASAENVRFYNGRVEKVRGWRAHGATVVGTPGLICRARFQDGSDFPIVCSDRQINRVMVDNTLTTLLAGLPPNPGVRWEHDSFPDANFFNRTDGALAIRQYDGTNIGVFSDFGSVTLAAGYTAPPRGKTLCQFQSHLLVGSITNDGAGNVDLQSVVSSDIADGEVSSGQYDWNYFGTSDAVIADVFEGNDEVMRIIRLADYLAIIKEGSIHLLDYVGYSAGVYRKRQPVSYVGTPSGASVIGVRGVIYFLGQDNFYRFNGVEPQPIGNGVYHTFLNTIMPDNPRDVWAFDDVLRKEIYWVGRDGKAVSFNYENGAWSSRQFPFTAAAYVNLTQRSEDWSSITHDWADWLDDWRDATTLNNLTILSGKSNGELAVVGEDNRWDANGSDIESRIETGDFHFGDESAVKMVNEMRVIATAGGKYPLELYVAARDSLDAGLNWTGPYPIVNNRATFAQSGRWFRFAFVKRDGYFSLEGYTPFVRRRGRH